MKQSKESLVIKTNLFQTFLSSLSKINDAAIIDVELTEATGIVASDDRSLFLLATLSGDFLCEKTFNLPSVRKLTKVLDAIPTETAEFTVNVNNLEYKDSGIRFKYHLFDDGILVRPKLSKKKIQSFQCDLEFVVESSFLSNILKQSSVFSDTNKLYVYTEDGNIMWSLKDEALDNTDVLTIVGETNVDFDLSPVIFNLDNIRLLTTGKNEQIKIRVNSNLGVAIFHMDYGDLKLDYIASSLTI